MQHRRNFLINASSCFGGLALATMLQKDAHAQEDGALAELHHRPRAKRVVQLFMAGAASHLDLWDHKPLLKKLHGQDSDFGEHVEAFLVDHLQNISSCSIIQHRVCPSIRNLNPTPPKRFHRSLQLLQQFDQNTDFPHITLGIAGHVITETDGLVN